MAINNDTYKKMVINHLGKMYNLCKDLKKIIYRMSFESHPIVDIYTNYLKKQEEEREKYKRLIGSKLIKSVTIVGRTGDKKRCLCGYCGNSEIKDDEKHDDVYGNIWKQLLKPRKGYKGLKGCSNIE